MTTQVQRRDVGHGQPKACYRLTATAGHNAATPQAVIGANGQHEAFPKSFPA